MKTIALDQMIDEYILNMYNEGELLQEVDTLRKIDFSDFSTKLTNHYNLVTLKDRSQWVKTLL
ncbi:hypothetical protein [Myroides sp.]|uniref:hypothetical protein n=1 Tax=Myroides sp. TaxID=1874736 RepID=UPI003F37CE36